MARKRASLKDKSTESLGPTQPTNRGIDVWFGEASGEEAGGKREVILESKPATAETSPVQQSQPGGVEEINHVNQPNQEQEHMPANGSDNLSDLDNTPAAAVVGTPAESLPVNEADTGVPGIVASEEVVDELGLPVALEAPPADLIPAVPAPASFPDGGMPVSTAVPQVANVLSGVSPTAVVWGNMDVVMAESSSGDEAVDVNDLSGLSSEEDMSGLLDKEAAPAPIPPGTSSPAMATGVGQTPGLGQGMVTSAPGVPVSTPQPAFTPTYPTPSGRADSPFLSSKAPPPTALPGAGVPAIEPDVSPSTGSVTIGPMASPSPRPAAPGTGASGSFLPRNEIESFSGIVSETIQVTPQSILPEDVDMPGGATSNIITVKESESANEDAALIAKVVRFIGPERRDTLDNEIESLYNLVATELSSSKEDTEFALSTLRQAQDLVFEAPHQYDEALYAVATIRAMIARKRNIRRWSYTWGLFVFFYALAALGVFVAGYLLSNLMNTMFISGNESLKAVAAAWFSALAGGVGGSLGILYSLYWHVAFKQDFDKQYIMYYLVQPVMGFFLGFAVYFIVASGFLLVNFAINSGTNSSSDVLSATTVIAIQVLLGFIAGFRQRFVLEMIDKIVQRVSPTPPDDTADRYQSGSASDQREPTGHTVAVEVKKGSDGASRVEVEQ